MLDFDFFVSGDTEIECELSYLTFIDRICYNLFFTIRRILSFLIVTWLVYFHHVIFNFENNHIYHSLKFRFELNHYDLFSLFV